MGIHVFMAFLGKDNVKGKDIEKKLKSEWLMKQYQQGAIIEL